MTPGLTPKIRTELAYIFELNEFNSVRKWIKAKQAKITQQMVALDMSTPNADKIIAMWQGQHNALEFLLKEWQKLHKGEIDKAIKDHKR